MKEIEPSMQTLKQYIKLSNICAIRGEELRTGQKKYLKRYGRKLSHKYTLNIAQSVEKKN